ncbi:XRE family transcriptional regulator [Enterococcus faecalis]|nr:XRE family transcriptional regulator [Enterococcus faecalis]MBD9974257.1 XRE family transcriptional regulator [Enterococcus faecalis]
MIIGGFFMFINDFLKHTRTTLNLSQTTFYKDVLSRSTADKFEKNKTSIKLSCIPILADRLDLTCEELLHYSSDTLYTDFDKLRDSFLSKYTKLQSSKEQSEIHEVIQDIIDIYIQCLEPKYYSLKYFNLYLLIKISCSEFTDKILEVDKADLLDLKKIYKTRKLYTSSDYKVLANLITLPLFTVDDLNFMFDVLYPLENNISEEILYPAYLALTNLTTKHIKNKDYNKAKLAINNFEKQLKVNPSYKFKLICLHDRALLDFLTDKINNSSKLTEALQIINIIDSCEPSSSSLADRMKEATVSIIEKEDNTKDIIAAIANTKSSIDYMQTIPPNIVKT